MLSVAREQGINTFDTAMNYGEAHERLGEAVKRGILVRPNIITKIRFSAGADAGPAAVRDVERALSQLGCERLEGLLLHHEGDFSREEVWETLRKIQKRGLVDKIGISVYSPAEVLRCAHRREISLIQLPFNILDHRWETLDWRAIFPQGQRPTVHARSVFLQGLLLSEAESWPPSLRGAFPEIRAFLVAAGPFGNPLELCLRYVKSVDWVDGVIVGVYGLPQLKELIAASDLPALDGEALRAIRALRPTAPLQVLDPRTWTASVDRT